MTSLCRGFVLVVLSACVVQAEWFDKGKVRYKTLDGKWRKAAIHVTDDGIEVYDRKHRSLVATFPGFDPESDHYRRRREVHLRRGAAGLSLLGGALVLGYLATSSEPGYVTRLLLHGLQFFLQELLVRGERSHDHGADGLENDRNDVCSRGCNSCNTIKACAVHVPGWAEVDHSARRKKNQVQFTRLLSHLRSRDQE